MSSLQINVGSIIQIPLDSKAHSLAVVLFLSQTFRGVMLLGLPFDKKTDVGLMEGHPGTTEALVYTSVASVEAGRWPVVDSVSLSTTAALTERIDGTSVWVLDRKVRQATGEDKAILPTMRVAGEGAIESIASQLAGMQELTKFTKLTMKRTDSLLKRVSESAGQKQFD